MLRYAQHDVVGRFAGASFLRVLRVESGLLFAFAAHDLAGALVLGIEVLFR